MMMKTKILGLLIIFLTGCAAQSARQGEVYNQINAEMQQAAQEKAKPFQPDAVSNALLPPLKIELPTSAAKPLEPRFDLVVNNAPANQVFMGIVSGTRYSMLVHPDVTGSISVNLKDVSVFEALDALRELYGYDYKVEGSRIFIGGLSMQTRVFTINYLSGSRKGTSDIRVISSSVSDTATTGSSSSASSSTTTSTAGKALESSKITTTSSTDFWAELKTSLDVIVGSKDGRSVVVSPQSGIIVIRAMPDELRNVEHYLSAAQVSVERQVILEAKIVEVQLNDGYQSGINWAAFKTGPNSRASLGQLVPGSTLSPTGVLTGGTTVNVDNVLTGTPLTSTPGTNLASGATAAGSLIGLAFQTSNFAALISFLETQGNVQVLSSPRIATLNNQKAVLKVGTDEFFVTNVSTTTTTGTSTTSTPSVTLQPFFSGIALDVTPQIDESGHIILHIHPSVSKVTTVQKTIDLGSSGGTLNLPLASSAVNETDSIVRAQDGQIVAIGGLMKQTGADARSQVPGLGDIPGVGNLFRQTVQSSQKVELVILLKPTVVKSNADWSRDILDSSKRIQAMDRKLPTETEVEQK
jgi:MSHA biogenesis protein MshL